MAILTDLIIAGEGAAEIVIDQEAWPEDFPVLCAKILFYTTLETLFELVDPTSPDVRNWSRPLAERDSAVWVNQLPPYFVERLAQLPDAEISQLATGLSQDELFRDNFFGSAPLGSEDMDFLNGFLREVCVFLRQAVESGKCVYLLTCV